MWNCCGSSKGGALIAIYEEDLAQPTAEQPPQGRCKVHSADGTCPTNRLVDDLLTVKVGTPPLGRPRCYKEQGSTLAAAFFLGGWAAESEVGRALSMAAEVLSFAEGWKAVVAALWNALWRGGARDVHCFGLHGPVQ